MEVDDTVEPGKAKSFNMTFGKTHRWTPVIDQFYGILYDHVFAKVPVRTNIQPRVFDFSAGEVRVTLSDRDDEGRDDIAIMADAMKWVKIE